ncbi:Putative transport protein, partial [Salmonella enterica subsp. enterica serovar Rubislaw str. A4-653]
MILTRTGRPTSHYYSSRHQKTGTDMAKPIITLNGLKIVIMLGMLVV